MTDGRVEDELGADLIRHASTNYLGGHSDVLGGMLVAKKDSALIGTIRALQGAGGAEAAMKIAAQVKIFTRATSLGGTESLLEHRASIEWPDSKTPPNLMRVSVGMEHADDLIEDLEQASV
ncbi:PLP-dependent transferase [Tumebacillus algifaecis]|nr:PLP-dependent transferase [Tumebacillus algifaecis]